MGQLVSVSRNRKYSDNSISRICLETETKQNMIKNVDKENVQEWDPNISSIAICTKESQRNESPDLSNLNKTCKIRHSAVVKAEETDSSILSKYSKSIENMNDMINYMINVLKGYTRNGVRRNCWITSQGPDYTLKMQTSNNIRQKYGNFERVRQLCEEDSACRRLIRDFDRISAYYFSRVI